MSLRESISREHNLSPTPLPPSGHDNQRGAFIAGSYKLPDHHLSTGNQNRSIPSAFNETKPTFAAGTLPEPNIKSTTGGSKSNGFAPPSYIAQAQLEPNAAKPKPLAPLIGLSITTAPRTVSPPNHNRSTGRRVPSFHPIEGIDGTLTLDFSTEAGDFDLMDSSFDNLLQETSAFTDAKPAAANRTATKAKYEDIDFGVDPLPPGASIQGSNQKEPVAVASADGREERKTSVSETIMRPIIASALIVPEIKLPMRSRRDEIHEVFKLDHQELLEQALNPRPVQFVSGSKASGTNGAKSKPKAKKAKKPSIKSLIKRTADYDKFSPQHIKNYSQRLKECADFRKKHGHCMIPHQLEENPGLAKWAKRQRYQYKLYVEEQEGKPGKKSSKQEKSSLTPERIAALEALDFCWNRHDAVWFERFEELKKFIAEDGGFKPSKSPTLATWQKCQRRQYRLKTLGQKSNITEKRIELLESIGFVWDGQAGPKDYPESDPEADPDLEYFTDSSSDGFDI